MSLPPDIHYKLMQLLQANPQMSQREVARHLGVSLGKVNYCLRALIRKGWLKTTHFTNSHDKAAYLYVLTPRGIEEKARLAMRFLQAKISEYESLKSEIRHMRREVDGARKAQAGTRAAGIVDVDLRRKQRGRTTS